MDCVRLDPLPSTAGPIADSGPSTAIGEARGKAGPSTLYTSIDVYSGRDDRK